MSAFKNSATRIKKDVHVSFQEHRTISMASTQTSSFAPTEHYRDGAPSIDAQSERNVPNSSPVTMFHSNPNCAMNTRSGKVCQMMSTWMVVSGCTGKNTSTVTKYSSSERKTVNSAVSLGILFEKPPTACSLSRRSDRACVN